MKVVLVALLFIVGLLASAASAVPSQATAQSRLNCQPRELTPGQSSKCYIYVKDSLGVPTTAFEINDFVVSIRSARPEIVATMSSVTLTSERSVLTFTVGASAGTILYVDAKLSRSDEPIVESGQSIFVLGSATKLSDLRCDKQQLALRGTAQCTATVTGPSGVPALVESSDLFFSEDHGAGSFELLEGSRTLVFNFTAPSSLSVMFSKFRLRVSLVGIAEQNYIELPVMYPALPATGRSVLRCVESVPQLCILNAADDIGPVRLNPEQFVLRFEKETNTSGSATWEAYDGMVDTWNDVAGATGSSFSRRLTFTMKEPNEVFTGRLTVYVRESDRTLTEVQGSPFQFISGLAPAPDEAFFRRCDRTILVSRATVSGYLEVDDGLIADPSYFSFIAGGGGDIGSLEYSRGENGRPRLFFHYTAPVVHERTEDKIFAMIGGHNIQRSPYKMVVYPRKDVMDDSEGQNDGRHKKEIVLGTVFFGLCILFGIIWSYRAHASKPHSHPAPAPAPAPSQTPPKEEKK